MDPSKNLIVSGKVVSEGFNEGTLRFLLAVVALVLTFMLIRALKQATLRWLHPWLSIRWLNLDTAVLGTFLVAGLASFAYILRFLHIDPSTLTVVFGALSLGIGFGLQAIFANFVSGLIILLERPFHVGDRVILEGQEGNVVDIGLRASTVLTNDGVSVIVPNSLFITGKVTNRSLDNPLSRFKVPVQVAYGTDPRHLQRVLLDVASAHALVVMKDQTEVVFEAFGDHGLKFYLWAWIDTRRIQRASFVSELNFAIHHALEEEGIQVPFPQLEVHLKSAGEA